MFRKKKMVDERIENVRNNIYKEIYYIVLVICILSISIKLFSNGFSTTSITTELIILIGAGSYYSLRAAKLGIFSADIELHDAQHKISYNVKTILLGSAFGLFIAFAMGLNSAVNYASSTAQAFTYFFVVFGVCIVIYVPIFVVLLMTGAKSAAKISEQANKKMLDE